MTLSSLRKAFLLFSIAAIATVAAAQEVINGALDDGSLYEFQVPADWNGNLVLYAHEYYDPEFFGSAQSVTLPPVSFMPLSSILVSLRSHLLDRGYAVGYSSYASNGWALQSAISDTHALRGVFSYRFGKPRQTFLIGVSMGALAVTHLAEQHPQEYSGVLALCGVLGGTTAEVKYAYDASVLYHFFFKPDGLFGPFSYGLQDGDLAHPVTLSFFSDPTITQGVVTNLVEGLREPVFPTVQYVATAKIPGSDVNEIIEGSVWALGFAVSLGPDLLARTHGHLAFENASTVYHDPLFPDLDPLINSSVRRYDGAIDALLYLDHYYQPSGKLTIPMYTLHTTRDASVPIWHERMYAELVAQQGNSQNLYQQSMEAFGHCGYSVVVPSRLDAFTEQATSAFDALATWVSTGSRPQ